jgi:hypothetical protein
VASASINDGTAIRASRMASSSDILTVGAGI